MSEYKYKKQVKTLSLFEDKNYKITNKTGE